MKSKRHKRETRYPKITKGICRNCKLVNAVRAVEWGRAANPRCSACGGQLDRPRQTQLSVNGRIRQR